MLQFIFKSDQIIYVIVIILFMISVAAWNAAKRGKGLRGLVWRIGLAIATMELLMMGILLSLHIIEATPQYIIPISGMTIGSAMVVSGLFINHIKHEIQQSKGEIETLLSLGATIPQAIQEVRKRSVKFSMIPTIDGMKTVGLVQLPGMMTGMIIAGADPVVAVRYQILIVFSFTASLCHNEYAAQCTELPTLFHAGSKAQANSGARLSLFLTSDSVFVTVAFLLAL